MEDFKEDIEVLSPEKEEEKIGLIDSSKNKIIRGSLNSALKFTLAIFGLFFIVLALILFLLTYSANTLDIHTADKMVKLALLVSCFIAIPLGINYYININ